MSQRRTQEEFEELAHELTGGEYAVIGRYIDALTNIYFRHNICGRIIKMRPNRFLHEGGRCKYCNKISKKGIPLPPQDERVRRILVVDDDPIFNQICVENLSSDVLNVETITNPLEAIEKYKSEPYDLLILDLLMPDMDGLELMAKIKDDFPAAKIIMISGWEGNDKAEFKNVLNSTKLLGATETMHKPIEPEELKELVESVLILNEENEELESQPTISNN
ncbi:MAG: hypothetical protein COA79_16655 [Planctomycetota bacterium]|nr:MAG: hypothetical protein COA79_16655 [Planctomycetota bacterium]